MLNGIENNDIATLAGVHPVYVSYVLHGHRIGWRVRIVIAQALGVAVQELWPDKERRVA
jgi:lambda repressor-like predicted transcriptional regulator